MQLKKRINVLRKKQEHRT